MRIALLMNLALRKLGSLEGWVVAISRAARLRGHAVDVYARVPVHPEVARSLRELGCNFDRLESLESFWTGGVRKLSSYDVVHINMFQPRSTMALMGRRLASPRDDHRSQLRSRAERGDAAICHCETGGPLDVRQVGRAGRRLKLRPGSERMSLWARQAQGENGLQRCGRGPVLSATSSGFSTRSSFDALGRLPDSPRGARRSAPRGRGNEGADRSTDDRWDGPEESNLCALAAQLGIRERVEFAGLRDDVPALVERSDIFVHPAIWAEAFGLTIAEAMAHARPVVASNTGGIPEIVIEGIHGRLVEPGNALALAKALDSLASDPGLRTKMGAAARDRVLERFTLDACVDGHLCWMEEITGHATSFGSGRPGMPRT